MTAIYIRTSNWIFYPVSGTTVDSKDVERPVVEQGDYIEISREPVWHKITPTAYVPSKGKPFVVTRAIKMPRGYHIRSSRRFGSLAAALKEANRLSA